MDIRRFRVGLVMCTALIVACSDDGGADASSDASDTQDTSPLETGDSGESSGEGEATTDPAETSEGETEEGSETGETNPSSCAEGEIARGYDGTELECEALDGDARVAMNDNCQTFFGWTDKCDGCAEAPEKWGFTGGSCTLVGGDDSQCATQALDGHMFPMLGINTDGLVNGDDKFYTGFDCVLATPTTSTNATCPAGQFVTGIDAEGTVSCADLASLATEWANDSCGAYLGWTDGCTNCAEPPVRWVYAGGEDCDPGAGEGNTCVSVNVDGRIVNLGSVDMEGEVDSNDTFYLSVDCLAVEPTTSEGVVDQCEPGAFVSAIAEDGTLTCTGAGALLSGYVRDNCYAYLGWRDGCNDCTEPPTNWAAATASGCGNKSQNAQCNEHGLGLSPNQFMASIGLDGEADDNDKFYVAWTCREP